MALQPSTRAADSTFAQPSPAAPQAPADTLPRRLGFWATTAVVIGTIIGSGIFRVSAGVATDVGSVGGIVAVWVLGGVITLCGALALAELTAAFPEPGGVFVHLREIYGPLVAFLFGWTMLFMQPAAVGAIALVFGEYLSRLVPLSPTGTRVAASLAIVIAAAAGYRSVRGAGAIVGVATLAKLAGLAAIVAIAFLFGDGGAGSFGAGAPVGSVTRFGGMGLGLVGALWAYNGIQDAASVAGEVRSPGRTVPRAIIAGIALVIATYVLANAAYLYVLPFDVLRASPLVASETAVRAIGPAGARIVAATVMISTFGAVNGLVLTTPRYFYAMARQRLLFAPLGRVHPRFETPHVAVVTCAAIAVLAVWARGFEQLTEAFILGIWPFLALAVAGVIVLRRRRPELARPYRVPGYPIVPLVFIAGTAAVVVSALIAHPATTLAGMGLTLLGAPIYFVRRRAATR